MKRLYKALLTLTIINLSVLIASELPRLPNLPAIKRGYSTLSGSPSVFITLQLLHNV